MEVAGWVATGQVGLLEVAATAMAATLASVMAVGLTAPMAEPALAAVMATATGMGMAVAVEVATAKVMGMGMAGAVEVAMAKALALLPEHRRSSPDSSCSGSDLLQRPFRTTRRTPLPLVGMVRQQAMAAAMPKAEQYRRNSPCSLRSDSELLQRLVRTTRHKPLAEARAVLVTLALVSYLEMVPLGSDASVRTKAQVAEKVAWHHNSEL